MDGVNVNSKYYKGRPQRDLIIEMHAAVAVLNERTKGLPKITEQVGRNANDIRWIRRLMFGGWGLGGVSGLGFGIFKLFGG